MTTPVPKTLQHFSFGWMGSLRWDFYLSDNECEEKVRTLKSEIILQILNFLMWNYQE